MQATGCQQYGLTSADGRRSAARATRDISGSAHPLPRDGTTGTWTPSMMPPFARERTTYRGRSAARRRDQARSAWNGTPARAGWRSTSPRRRTLTAGRTNERQLEKRASRLRQAPTGRRSHIAGPVKTWWPPDTLSGSNGCTSCAIFPYLIDIQCSCIAIATRATGRAPRKP